MQYNSTKQKAGDLLSKIKKLIDEPKELYWIEHSEHGDGQAEYCYECVLKLKEYICESKWIDLFKKSEFDHPLEWKGSEESDLHICRSWGGYTSDGLEFCHLCSCILWVSLTDYGAKDELSHYKKYGISNDWESFCFLLEAAYFNQLSTEDCKKVLEIGCNAWKNRSSFISKDCQP